MGVLGYESNHFGTNGAYYFYYFYLDMKAVTKVIGKCLISLVLEIVVFA